MESGVLEGVHPLATGAAESVAPSHWPMAIADDGKDVGIGFTGFASSEYTEVISTFAVWAT
jgi:hypothetical protein